MKAQISKADNNNNNHINYMEIREKQQQWESKILIVYNYLFGIQDRLKILKLKSPVKFTKVPGMLSNVSYMMALPKKLNQLFYLKKHNKPIYWDPQFPHKVHCYYVKNSGNFEACFLTLEQTETIYSTLKHLAVKVFAHLHHAENNLIKEYGYQMSFETIILEQNILGGSNGKLVKNKI